MDLDEIKSKNDIAFENYLLFKRMQKQNKKVNLFKFFKGLNIVAFLALCASIFAGVFNPLFFIGSCFALSLNLVSIFAMREIDFDSDLADMRKRLKKEKKLEALETLMNDYENAADFNTKAQIFYNIQNAVATNGKTIEDILAIHDIKLNEPKTESANAKNKTETQIVADTEKTKTEDIKNEETGTEDTI